MARFSTDSTGVWIQDQYHKHYPNYVRILEVIPDAWYKVQIQTGVMTDIKKGPIELLKEEQLSDDLIGG